MIMRYLTLGLIMLIVIGALTVVPSYASNHIYGSWETLCEKKLDDSRTTIDDFLCELDIIGMYDNLIQLNGTMLIHNDNIINLNNTVMSFNGTMTTNSEEIERLNAEIDLYLQLNHAQLIPNSPQISVENGDKISTITWSFTHKLIIPHATHFVIELEGVVVEENLDINTTSYIFDNLTNDVVYIANVIAVNSYGSSLNSLPIVGGDGMVELEPRSDEIVEPLPLLDVKFDISIEPEFIELGQELIINGTIINFKNEFKHTIDINVHYEDQNLLLQEQLFTMEIDEHGNFSKSLVFGVDIIYNTEINILPSNLSWYELTISYTPSDYTIETTKTLTHPIPALRIVNVIIDNIGSDFVELSWDIGTDPTFIISDVTGYEMRYYAINSMNMKIGPYQYYDTNSPTQSVRFDDLINDTKYKIEIYTISEYGKSHVSTTYITTLP